MNDPIPLITPKGVTEGQVLRGSGADQAEWVNDGAFIEWPSGDDGDLVTLSGSGVAAIPSGTYLGRIFANITHYGAVGQDAAKDTAAFHEALKSGLPVWIPPGIRFYIDTAFDSAVDAPTITDWVVLGAGRDRSILEWVGPDGETMLRLTKADGTTTDGVDDSGLGGRVSIVDVGFTSNATRGHTSQTYYYYTTTNTSDAGTQGTTTAIHLDNLSSRGAQLTRVAFTDYGTAVQADGNTFLVDTRGLWIRWCNIGVDLQGTVTASTIGGGSSIERCAIGIRTRFVTGLTVAGCVIQANYAGTDILTYTGTKWLTVEDSYFEASADPGITLAGTGVNADDVTRDIFLERNFGLEVRCRNHIRDVWVRDNNLRALDNDYSDQRGRRGIYLDRNRSATADNDPFGASDVTGTQAHEVRFLRYEADIAAGYWLSPPAPHEEQQLANELLHAVPIFVPTIAERTGDSLNVRIETSGETDSTVRLGLYANEDGLPGALIVDAGEVAGDSAGDKFATISEPVGGWVWVAAVAQNAASTPPSIQCLTSPPPGMSASGAGRAQGGNDKSMRHDGAVSGALPDPFVVSGSRGGSAGDAPFVAVEIT